MRLHLSVLGLNPAIGQRAVESIVFEFIPFGLHRQLSLLNFQILSWTHKRTIGCARRSPIAHITCMADYNICRGRACGWPASVIHGPQWVDFCSRNVKHSVLGCSTHKYGTILMRMRDATRIGRETNTSISKRCKHPVMPNSTCAKV